MKGTVSLALVLGASLLEPHIAAAYTISVDCVNQAITPGMLPYENVLCTFAWTPGGNTLHRFGKMESNLEYRPGGGVVQHVDQVATETFNLSTRPSPLQTWIACTNVTGSFRVHTSAWLYQYIVGGISGPGYFFVRDLQIDAEFASVYAPLVPCT